MDTLRSVTAFRTSAPMNSQHPTRFASAARSGPAEILDSAELLKDGLLQTEILDAVPQLILVLDENRQIVHFNQTLAGALGVEDASEVLGKRPGEVLSCLHAKDEVGGCGTASACSHCDAVRAVLTSLCGHAATEECRVTLAGNAGSMDLRIHASPLETPYGRYSFVVAQDIADEKRRQALERTFFHDLLNLSGGLASCLELRQEEDDPSERMELDDTARLLSHQVVEVIQSQQTLLQMERGELEVRIGPVQPAAMIEALHTQFAYHPLTEGKRIALQVSPELPMLTTDDALAGRVLTNMLKNALEASFPGDQLEVGAAPDDDGVRFWVSNPEVMTERVQAQVFQRSFSTKGAGRGLGTYSMKL